jgi:hypothetical protein
VLARQKYPGGLKGKNLNYTKLVKIKISGFIAFAQ